MQILQQEKFVLPVGQLHGGPRLEVTGGIRAGGRWEQPEGRLEGWLGEEEEEEEACMGTGFVD